MTDPVGTGTAAGRRAAGPGASRVCVTLLGSARTRRETYVGEWIPEPLPDPAEWIAGAAGRPGVDPADRITLDESVTTAFLSCSRR